MPDAAERAAAWLEELALAHGEPFAGGGNRPVRLDDPDVLWFIARGVVNVFVAREQDGEFVEYKHLLRAGRGRLLFPAAGPVVLLAKGLPDSELRRVPRDVLLADERGAVVDQVDRWVAEVSAAVARDATYRPHFDHFLTAGEPADLEAGTAVSAKGGVLWTSSRDGDLAFLSTEELDPDGSGFMPLAPGAWISVSAPTRIEACTSRELHRAGHLSAALADFHRLALAADDLNRRLLLADAVNLRTVQTRYRRESEAAARHGLFDLLDTRGARPGSGGAALQAALDLIGRHEGIRFRAPPASRGRGEIAEAAPSLNAILTASGVRGRDVALYPSDRWWLGDSGAMLAFRREDGAPVALLPGGFGRYRMVDPATGRSAPVNAARAASLRPSAIFCYQPLPPERATGAGALARVAFRRWKGDVARFATAGLLAGLATLAPAVLLGVFADAVAPTGRVGLLAWLTAGVLLLAVTAAMLKVLEGTALMRLEGRVAARLTAALWDRLLSLPAVFFRNFTAGDLGTRAMAFHSLRDQVSGVVMGSLLSIIFLLPAFVLLFVHDAAMGWLGLAGGLVSLAVTLTLGVRQVPHHRRLAAARRSLTGVPGAVDRRRAQAARRGEGMDGVHAVGAGLPGTEAQRDECRRIERAPGRLHGHSPLAGDRRIVRHGDRPGARRAVRGRLPGRLRHLHGVHDGDRGARPVHIGRGGDPAGCRAGLSDPRGDAQRRRRGWRRAGIARRRAPGRGELPLYRRRPHGAARRVHRCSTRRVRRTGPEVPAPAKARCCASSWAWRNPCPAVCTTMPTIWIVSTGTPCANRSAWWCRTAP